jgi:hypothetical protein
MAPIRMNALPDQSGWILSARLIGCWSEDARTAIGSNRWGVLSLSRVTTWELLSLEIHLPDGGMRLGEAGGIR